MNAEKVYELLLKALDIKAQLFAANYFEETPLLDRLTARLALQVGLVEAAPASTPDEAVR